MSGYSDDPSRLSLCYRYLIVRLPSHPPYNAATPVDRNLLHLFTIIHPHHQNKIQNHHHHHHHHHHQSLNREGLWGTTDDFATSLLYFSLFSTALWDLPNSRPVHSLMLSSRLFLCLPCLLPPFTVPCKMVLTRPDEWET